MVSYVLTMCRVSDIVNEVLISRIILLYNPSGLADIFISEEGLIFCGHPFPVKLKWPIYYEWHWPKMLKVLLIEEIRTDSYIDRDPNGNEKEEDQLLVKSINTCQKYIAVCVPKCNLILPTTPYFRSAFLTQIVATLSS